MENYGLIYKGEVIGGATADSSASGGPSEEVYSAEETRIGTWIDGKPIYRKVFSLTSPSNNSVTSQTVAEYDADIDKVLYMYGTITYGSGQTASIPFYLTNEDYVYVGYNLSSHINTKNTIRIACGRYEVNLPIVLIMEYTKTTD